MTRTRESYEVSKQAIIDEWSIFDACRIDGCYPGQCEHGAEFFQPVAVVNRWREREAADVE